MTVRLSEVGEYSQAVAVRPNLPEVANVVPTRAAQQALSRRRFGGLALTEVNRRESASLSGLGELVQVVTSG